MELGNPRFYWTYSDEDLQRLAKEIAQSCHVDNLPAMVLYKYLIWVFDMRGPPFGMDCQCRKQANGKKKSTSMYTHAIPISMPQCTSDILAQIRKWDQGFQYLAQATAGFHFKRNKPIQNITVSFSRPGLT